MALLTTPLEEFLFCTVRRANRGVRPVSLAMDTGGVLAEYGQNR